MADGWRLAGVKDGDSTFRDFFDLKQMVSIRVDKQSSQPRAESLLAVTEFRRTHRAGLFCSGRERRYSLGPHNGNGRR